MKGRSWLILCLTTITLVLLSSCAFNLFVNFELRNLLTSGTVKQKLEAASSALSGGSYDAAIALAASVINEKLGLNLKIEDLEKLLDSTSTVYELAEEIQDATFTKDLFDAVKILVEAVAFKTKKDISSLADEVIEILQELGIDLGFTRSKSNGSDFWAKFETNAGTIVNFLAETSDGRHTLKLLTSGYYFIAKNSTNTTLPASLCSLYDIGYMFNLLLDIDDDGNVTDEKFVEDVRTNPASIVEFSRQATSGLYKDKDDDCLEFIWAYGILQEMFEILKIQVTFVTLDATTLSEKEHISDIFDILFGE
uniref:Lipoprotein n=1 Tax=Pseudothermotoga hypogea TaxID=57487 RepID=A0A832MQF1_9THEM